MKRNCEWAREIADLIRSYVPTVLELYVPAEHEAFVNRAYRGHYLTVKQILEIDCNIIEEYSDVLLVFAPYGPPVEGCRIEMDHAITRKIPVIIFESFNDLAEKLEPFLKEKGLIG
jgi:hypothetical protein